MLTKVTIQNFKRFKDPTEFNLQPQGVTYLAGGNNSGKSTLLQALAVWEFARSVLEVTKGSRALVAGYSGEGAGLCAEEFTPIALPDLKHLFSDLRTFTGKKGEGYPLRVRCEWEATATPGTQRHLEIALSHSNDRLFVKPSSSNLASGEPIPRMAYLPPFAGIGSREERMLPSVRKRWIGKGLAGAVLRNLLYDFWDQNQRVREQAKDSNGKIPESSLAQIRKTDSWEQLSLVLEEVFKTGLTVKQFNELYHTTIEVLAWEGALVKKKFQRKPSEPEKDLMVEGSGFLQWLSVYALALNRDIQVLLLDEPDAHLHPALQGHLTHKLAQLARENQKQVLLATHSTTILSETKVERIFRMEERSYLTDERSRVGLFVGLGSQYAPRLDQLKRYKRLFLHDGPSDLEVLQAWAKTLGLAWPENLIEWKYTKDRTAREVLFDELHSEISGLRAISLQDRDDYPFAETKADLTFDNLPVFKKGLGLRRWRRRNIENYLLHPASIARAASKSEQEVRALLNDPHGVNIPNEFTKSGCAQTLANTDGKEILTKHARSITVEFGVTYKQIAEVMLQDEIPDDGKTLLQQIVEMCKP